MKPRISFQPFVANKKTRETKKMTTNKKQYTDKYNRIYKIVNGRVMVWNYIYGWSKSAMYLTPNDLLTEGKAIEINDPLSRR